MFTTPEDLQSNAGWSTALEQAQPAHGTLIKQHQSSVDPALLQVETVKCWYNSGTPLQLLLD